MWVLEGHTFTDDCLTPTNLKSDNGVILKKVIKPFSIQISNTASMKVINLIIMPGYLFDGASIPKYFHWLIGKPWDPRFLVSFILHDVAYGTHYFSRKASDEMLRDILLQIGKNPLKVKAIYSAVRTFGQGPWESPWPLPEGAARELCLYYEKEPK